MAVRRGEAERRARVARRGEVGRRARVDGCVVGRWGRYPSRQQERGGRRVVQVKAGGEEGGVRQERSGAGDGRG
jgi:hypothetical protein